MKSESWVTVAISDGDGWAAVVLGRSIRKSFTTKKLTIVISENVSPPMKMLLQKEFDLVVRFDASEVISESFAQLWIWNLENWQNCVYLDSKSYMMRNSDAFFSKNPISAFVSGKTQISAIVFRPNKIKFNELMELASSQSDDNWEQIVNTKFGPHLDKSTDFLVSFDDLRKYDGPEPHIVNFETTPWTIQFLNTTPNMEKLMNAWVSTFVHEVLPEVNSIKDEPTKKFLLASVEQYGLPPTNGPVNSTFDLTRLSELEEAIAVVGMSCRFPGANSPDEFWNLLIEGRDPIRHSPPERPRSKNFDPIFQAGFLTCPVDEFDAKFFGISPREAPFVDPQQRLLLEVIWESLENANINPQSLKGSNTGVFMGVWQQDYDRLLPTHGLSANDFHHRYLGNAFSATASRISFFLGLFGPNLAVESGCSSSSSGVHLACATLRREETNLAICTGVNLVLNVINPLSGDNKRAVVLAQDYRCKTFDESADGFARAEGCGSVILKRYVDALRHGDNILGLIRGSSLNNDGPGISFGTPNAIAQERVFREALQDANVAPSEVSFVEAHGTGTMVGDPTEVYAIGRVYSEGRKTPLFISSVKTNIGHAEACAGMAGLIKVLLCFQHQTIPPHLHLKKLNPRVDLDTIPAKIPLTPTRWEGEPRIAAISSFSMSGTNVHMILQEAPIRHNVKRNTEHKLEMIGFSAKSEEALESLRESYVTFLQKNVALPLVDIAYSANTGRANLPHRIALVSKDTKQLLLKLEQRSYFASRSAVQRQKVVFLFTGQGSQYFGMAKSLYNASPVFRDTIDLCDGLFQKYLAVSLRTVLWKDSSLLEKTIYCQPAIFCLEYALLQLWSSFGVQADIVLGHSVGEFCASVCADILSLEDGMKLVVERSRLVDSISKGSMLAVKSSFQKVENLISLLSKKSNRWIDVAAINGEEEVVVSSTTDNIAYFSTFCANNGVKTQQISASHAFHSREMEPVLIEFGQVASEVITGKRKCTYISGTIAREMEDNEFGTTYWQRHLRDTVRFADAIKCAWLAEGRVFIEIGAQPILLGLAIGNLADSSLGIFCPSLRKNEEDLSSLLNSIGKLYVAGIDVDWSRWFGQRPKTVILPTYPFQRQKFWYVSEDESIEEEPILHPLLGRQMPLPVADRIFNQILSLKELSYIQDHRVAERVVVPAAAFLETMMAAGCEVLQGGRIQIPFSVEDLIVEAALLLEKATQIQVVVTTESGAEGLQYKIGIHRRVEDKWRRHAHGSFYPRNHLTNSSNIDLQATQHRLELKDSITNTYIEIAKAGIQFGPKFQSIQKAWSGETEIITEIHRPDDFEKYICHPILLDAMIQTFAFRYALTCTERKFELQLPISIRKFTWLSREVTPEVYAYTSWSSSSSGNNGSVTLYASNGEPLAIMEGLELLRTNVHSFVTALNADQNHLPEFMEEIWRPTSGVTRSRIDTSLLTTKPSTHVTSCVERVTSYEHIIWDTFEALEKCYFLFLVRAIQECDWPWPTVGNHLSPSDWTKVTPPTLAKLDVKVLFKLFEMNNYLKQDSERSYRVLQELPSIEECEREIQNGFYFTIKQIGEDDPLFMYAKRCGQLLTSVLQGKVTPIAYMFPEDGNEIGAIRFYNETKVYRFVSEIAISLVLDAVTPIGGKNGVVRILEIGAGSGKSSIELMNQMTALSIPYQYTFTDISPVFLFEAKKKLPKGVTFNLLNIEKDPLKQGFGPEQFDIVIATQVIHATVDINQSLTHIRTLLRDGGLLILSEQFCLHNYAVLTFGVLDGWWRFQDFRELSPIIDARTWETCFRESGFSVGKTIGIFKGTNGGIIGQKLPKVIDLPICLDMSSNTTIENQNTWLIVSDESKLQITLTQKLMKSKRNVVIRQGAGDIPITLEGVVFFWTNQKQSVYFEQEKCKELLELCQNLISSLQNLKLTPRILLLTRGIHYIGDAGPGNPNPATAQALLKVFCNENPDFHIKVIDLDQDEENTEREAEEIFVQLWNKENEMFMALREDKVFVQRLVSCNQKKWPINFPNSDRFAVVNPPSKAIVDIQVVAAPKVELTGNKIEIAVKATALNFRDLFMILQPEGFIIPEYMDKEAGLDIAGIVSAVGPDCKKLNIGDEVFGFTASGGLASHVVVSERAMMLKPPEMTFTSASTIPCTFLTVFYSFIKCAKLTSEDRVLIHVATGGVGLAAIQVANYIGAEIYATAGSRRKREYLKYLGIKNVYHSRNTEFGERILKDSNGTGITVVLNSLTGPNFKETSLRVCADGARFVEIGKMNIWTPEDVQALRPDVNYFVVDLAEMAYKVPEELMDYTDAMAREFEKGIYTGLPHETFPLELVRDAFHHFQESKHIGKIVIRIPESKMSSDGRICHQNHIFHAESTYLITGGLGGLGMEVAKWMTTSGGKNIILVGRSSPNERASRVIENLVTQGNTVVVIQTDVGEFSECETLIKMIDDLQMPPLRGIMHAAGVISDSIIFNQSWTKFESTFKPKVQGAWNLHQLTLGRELEFFAMFSTAASILGMPGQSNHASANRFLDSFTQYRLAMGLPALTMNFGPWSDVGAAANIKIGQEGTFGIKAYTPKQGIKSIEKIFLERNTQTMICNIADWNTIKEFIRLGHYLDEMKSNNKNENSFVEEFNTMIEAIKTARPEKVQEKMELFMERILKQTLRIPENEQIDPDQNFSEIGVDSLMAMEMRNRLQGVLGDKTLTLSALQENRTIRSLSAHMTGLINSETVMVPDLEQMTREDTILPEDVQQGEIPPSVPSAFQHILVTGVTGHLGSHFIPEIETMNPKIKIHCLVRGANHFEATQRFLSKLKTYEFKNVHLDKIQIYAGDFRKPNFDLSEEDFNWLAENVDAVIHCGIKSNHIARYDDGGENSIRQHNVVGTLNVLKFAGTKKTKAVLYASSLLAVTKAEEDGTLSEEFPDDDNFGLQLKNGYCLSKFISEKLACEARRRGIPITVIRYASIFGNSQTGLIPTGYNHSWSILISCLRVKKFPRFWQNGIPFMAVDTAAHISMRIFLNDESDDGVYNLTSDSVASEDDIEEVFRKFGVEGEFVSFPEWRDLVFAEMGKNNALASFGSLYEQDETNEVPKYMSIHPLANSIPHLQVNKSSEKIKRNCPGIKEVTATELLDRHLQFHFNTERKHKVTK